MSRYPSRADVLINSLSHVSPPVPHHSRPRPWILFLVFFLHNAVLQDDKHHHHVGHRHRQIRRQSDSSQAEVKVRKRRDCSGCVFRPLFYFVVYDNQVFTVYCQLVNIRLPVAKVNRNRRQSLFQLWSSRKLPDSKSADVLWFRTKSVLATTSNISTWEIYRRIFKAIFGTHFKNTFSSRMKWRVLKMRILAVSLMLQQFHVSLNFVSGFYLLFVNCEYLKKSTTWSFWVLIRITCLCYWSIKCVVGHGLKADMLIFSSFWKIHISFHLNFRSKSYTVPPTMIWGLG